MPGRILTCYKGSRERYFIGIGGSKDLSKKKVRKTALLAKAPYAFHQQTVMELARFTKSIGVFTNGGSNWSTSSLKPRKSWILT